MYDLTPILKSAAENSATFKIEEIQDLGNNTYKFFSCDQKTYWLKPCFKITVKQISGGFPVGVITEVVNNVSFTAKFPLPLTEIENSFSVVSGTFIHGTLPMADVEISRIGNTDSTEVMPVIYHQEIYRKTKQIRDSVNDYIGRDLRIYFLDDYLQNNAMLTQDHYDNIIYQMENYANFFVENLKNDLRINKDYIDDNTHDIIFRVKTGEYLSGKNTKQIFTRNLSGVELVISIAVKKDNRCGGC